MANPNIKFFRNNVAPANPLEGYVWFSTDDRTIQVYKNGAWEIYSGLINATYSDNVLTLVPSVGDEIKVDLNDIYSEIAKLEGITDKVTTYVVTAISNETTAREASDKAINDILNGTKNDDGSETKGLVKEVEDLKDAIDALNGDTGSIATQIDNAIAALDLPNTYEAKGAAADALDAAKSYADGLAGNYDAAGAAAAAEAAAKAYVDGIVGDVTAEDGTVTKGLDSRIADLEAIDHTKLAEDASAAAVATILDGAPEKFDTLKEIAAWIAEADTAEDAASLVSRVSVNEQAIKDLEAGLEEAERVTAESHTNLNGRLETVETWKSGLTVEDAAVEGQYVSSVSQTDGKITVTRAALPDVDGKITTAIESLDSTATASTDYATFTVAEVDGKVVSEGSSISLTTGSFEENGADGLAVVSAVKAYVDSAWFWGEF